MKRKRTSSSTPSHSYKPFSADSISHLLDFCTENGVRIDPGLEIRYSIPEGADDGRPIAVFLREGGEDIPVDTNVVYIPKRAVLSMKSTGLEELQLPSGYEPVPFGVGAQLALALALYLEVVKGPGSRWHAYIQSLPENVVDLPVFWSTEAGDKDDLTRREDAKKACSWLRGTEVEQNNTIGLLKTIDAYYEEVVIPVFNLNVHHLSKASPSLKDFYRAYSLVSSRAFIVDAYHGLSMVPVADAFNHTTDNHSEYDVCPECGSLKQCPHDRDLEGTENDRNADTDNDELYYTMTTTSYIPSTTTEVFNTYGAHLSNAQLMAQYGFILDVNEADWVGWDASEIVGEDEYDKVMQIWRLCTAGLLEDAHGDSEVFYMPLNSGGAPDSRRVFSVNSDGRISVQLWCLLAISWVTETQGTLVDEDVVSLVMELLKNTSSDNSSEDTQASRRSIMERAAKLCEDRLGMIGVDGVNAGAELDEVPASMWRTRIAILQVMAEQAMLRSCIEECIYIQMDDC
ncbi:hypothetical protein WG66_014703 [Moniliophthora roreri]|nr:hypothetical protein WG66_014703 [Moniliophthora roreri]